MGKKILLTGGAGFIGSCILRTLNDCGIDEVVVSDNIGRTEKWKNLLNKRYIEYIHKGELENRIKNGTFGNVDVVIHMGACSNTTEKDFDYLWNNNVNYSKMLWKYCADNNIPFIYASSAATYGDGKKGFCDKNNIMELRPINAYGYSKQVFDVWAKQQEKKPSQYVGLKFFNVYGPNEYYKGSMASMVYHGYGQITNEDTIRLFKSANEEYSDGMQERDFVYVKDVCKVILFFLNHPEKNGLYNVGTGRAETFEKLATSIFLALGKKKKIEYIEMPKELKGKYQYHTRADIDALREAGYTDVFVDIEQGVEDYVVNYLNADYMTY